MGIPVGKLAVYVSASRRSSGRHAANLARRGHRQPGPVGRPTAWATQPRLRGAAYEQFVEQFVDAMASTFLRAVIQWEDFKAWNAHRLLARYCHRVPSFNDDIQGTGATALAGVQAASGILGLGLSSLRFLIVGAGAAGIGIGRLLGHALAAEGATRAAPCCS